MRFKTPGEMGAGLVDFAISFVLYSLILLALPPAISYAAGLIRADLEYAVMDVFVRYVEAYLFIWEGFKL